MLCWTIPSPILDLPRNDLRKNRPPGDSLYRCNIMTLTEHGRVIAMSLPSGLYFFSSQHVIVLHYSPVMLIVDAAWPFYGSRSALHDLSRWSPTRCGRWLTARCRTARLFVEWWMIKQNVDWKTEMLRINWIHWTGIEKNWTTNLIKSAGNKKLLVI